MRSTAADKVHFYPCNLSTHLMMPKTPENFAKVFPKQRWGPVNTAVCSSNGSHTTGKRDMESFWFPTQTIKKELQFASSRIQEEQKNLQEQIPTTYWFTPLSVPILPCGLQNQALLLLLSIQVALPSTPAMTVSYPRNVCGEGTLPTWPRRHSSKPLAMCSEKKYRKGGILPQKLALMHKKVLKGCQQACDQVLYYKQPC